MRVTHLGHSCLLVDMADTRVLIDPGTFAPGFEDLRDLDAIVVTHQHADHLDPKRFPDLLAANRQAAVFTDTESAAQLDASSSDVIAWEVGAEQRLGGLVLVPVGELHAVNHSQVPRCTNVGVVLRADGEPTLFHPGDAIDADPGPVDVLAVPLNAPWCKVSETLDFVRRIGPAGVIPIHDALLSEVGRRLYLGHVSDYGGEGLVVHDLAGRGATTVTVG